MLKFQTMAVSSEKTILNFSWFCAAEKNRFYCR